MQLKNWNDPDPAEVYHPISDQDWDEALVRYTGSLNDLPLRRCVEVARSLGAETLVIETRYLDLDYRSEFSAYYSRQFADVPDSAHRLHFFTGKLDSASLWQIPSECAYIGYIVVRPALTGLVSRAMLPPPADVANAVRTAVKEKINFFGRDLYVTGVPFAQQDAQLGACAQMAAWMCHFTAQLRGDAVRRTKADFSLKADACLHPGRSLPTGGLTVQQLSELFRTFELPAMYYLVGDLPSPQLPWQPPIPTPPVGPAVEPGTWDHRIVPVACRHLNSGNPVLVGTHNHAFILCGYRRSSRPGWIEFIRHDDQAGPYLVVHDVLNDIDPRTGKVYGAWRTMHVPLPNKLWLSPEAAERKGGQFLLNASAQITTALSGSPLPFTPLADLIKLNRLALRTYAVRSNEFKADLARRGLAPEFEAEYRLARLPRYIWVVEAIDRDLRNQGKPCVLGEAVIDGTSSDHCPEQLALHIHGLMWLQQTDGGVRFPITGTAAAYLSGGIGDP